MISVLPPEFQNQWCDFRPTGSRTLLITFSPMAVIPGKFFPYRSVNNLPYDILRFNCPESQWYVNGIPSILEGGESFESLITSFISFGQYSKVIVFGGSKGGFGALDIGLRIPATSIIAAGAETLLGLTGGYSKNHISAAHLSIGRQRAMEWPSLAQTTKANILTMYGRRAEIDLVFAAWSSHLLGVDPVLFECEHSVPMYIEKHHSIAALIESCGFGVLSEFIAEHRVNLDLAPYLMRAIKAASQVMVQSSESASSPA